ncbi:MAG: DegT/DnrJ/EryC1/StrS family aminotransferase [Balneola sp.]|nr:DegT/DnrJ/EryC1/StrS family aminotransferase [Balneola sp.]MBO6651953.1 DegT/DnrJ/EryC1/StrS family aminotransferase [Balneola sp.]MBO6711788.1 DegT/DnrJ/EryC1/StrS family aminotransferase [Balneola sp.]MBO6799982.1 DegT/DnrJ/EryC1/StrS family aminotransferase [Balneola sp.]MBO6871227.1 DegT/DnrJ/EryC1/StrS family aminotransferase [Balneola sp.]
MIPLLDLQAQYRSIKKEVDDRIQEVLDAQYFIMGDSVKNFEKEINSYIGANHSFGCASGSDALLLALMAIDIEPGDYVITSPFTFFATAGAISRLGAIPIFIDIEHDSFNIDPEKIREFLEGKSDLSKKLQIPFEKIKAIIPVHLYGQMADMDPIMEIAKQYDLFVIEDAAQSIGSKYKGKDAGTIGDFGCFSFFPSKNLGAYGDGGLITVKDDTLAEKTNILRLHGAKPKYHHKFIGINSRLDAIQAAVLSVKLKYLNEWSHRRNEIAHMYSSLFQETGLVSEYKGCSECSSLSSCEFPDRKIVLPKETTGTPEENGFHIYHQYTIRLKNRDSLSEFLDSEKIGNAVYYPVPLHIQECFLKFRYQLGDFPVSECVSQQSISLPIYPELKEEEIYKVVDAVSKFVNL